MIMASFTTRVELHNAKDPEDYEKLHIEMGNEKFTRTIKSDNGTEYHLPRAEYNKEGSCTQAEVLESAKRAASKVVKKYAVFVTESNGRTWYGLDKVIN